MAVIEEKDSLQLLIELMANFRDKRKIFPSCCILLSTLCKDYAIVQVSYQCFSSSSYSMVQRWKHCFLSGNLSIQLKLSAKTPKGVVLHNVCLYFFIYCISIGLLTYGLTVVTRVHNFKSIKSRIFPPNST